MNINSLYLLSLVISWASILIGLMIYVEFAPWMLRDA